MPTVQRGKVGMPQNAKATLAQRTPPPTDFIPDNGGSGSGSGGDFIPDGGGAAASGPTQFEQQRSPSAQRGFWGTLSDRAGQFKDFLTGKDNTPGQGTYTGPDYSMASSGIIDKGNDIAQHDIARQKGGRSLGYRVAAGLGEATGVADPVSSERSADVGDSWGVVGNAVADAAPVAVTEGMRAIGPLRTRIGASKSLESVPTRTLGDVIEAPSKAPAYAVRKAFPEPAARVAERQPLQSTLEQRMKDIEGARQTELSDRGKQEMQFGTEQAEPVEQAIDADTSARKAVPVSQSPDQYRGPQRTGVGVPGSPQQEAGYQPPVTRVPIRPKPSSPLTPEQVPGPDTAGKGNLLTPAAKRGDPRAAQETMRRGRQVMYVPAEEYPGTRLEGTLAERMGQSQPPNLAQRTGGATTPETWQRSSEMRTQERSPISPVEKAEIEQQVGRKLTDDEALAERQKLAEWQSNQGLRRGTVDVDPKQSAGLRDTQAKRKR